MDINRVLKESGNECNGMLVMFESDDAEIFSRNTNMVHNRTVDGWMPEELLVEQENKQQWQKLLNAPAKKSGSKKAKKSWKSWKPKAANKPETTTNEVVVRKHPKGKCGQQNCRCCDGFASKTIVYKTHTGPCHNPECFCHEKYIDYEYKLKQGESEDVKNMMESGFTDAHHQLSFETDDESPEEDWDAEIEAEEEALRRRNEQQVDTIATNEDWDRKEATPPLWYDGAQKEWVWAV